MEPSKKICQQEDQTKASLPGILIDIDGVILKGKIPIEGSLEAIKNLRTPVNELENSKLQNNSQYQGKKIPFTLLTNGGGCLERTKAESVNKCMSIQQDENLKLTEEELIINFTPLRPILQQYRDNNQLILIDGSLSYIDIMVDINITKYITVHEYVRCFPSIMPMKFFQKDEVEKNQEIIRKRLGLGESYVFEDPFQIHGIFSLYEPFNQEEAIQLICDLCTTENGTISKEYPIKKPSKHVPLYIVNNDLIYKSNFPLPRLAFGAFNIALVSCGKRMGLDIKITQYGKPEIIQFDYAKKRLQDRDENIQISNYYMIGDNPNSDIKGANQSGVVSILVKTGVHQEETNSKEHPAKHLVQNFKEAIELIHKLENIV